MPHLSPMSWLITPILMWTILFTLWSISWWSLSPKFPMITKKSKSPLSNPLWVW